MVVYNGIPLDELDEYKRTSIRPDIRKGLGFGDSDFVLLHLGTVCKRKAQLDSVKAFVRLIRSGKMQNGKLLIVGARCKLGLPASSCCERR